MPPPKPPARPLSPDDAAREARHQTDELNDEAKALEEELEALKAKYEMYFLGVEKREPVRWREETKKKVLRLKGAFTRNTGLKFRIQALHARFLSYERLWLRSAREREEGTYRRDVFKARLHAKAHDGERAPALDAGPLPAATPAAGVPLAAKPATAPAAPAVKPAAPASAAASARPAAPGGADPQVRALYDAYVEAKRRCGEDVSRITYDAVARTVAKQIPELKARYNAKSVDFKVEVRDGKAVLKAIPKV